MDGSVLAVVVSSSGLGESRHNNTAYPNEGSCEEVTGAESRGVALTGVRSLTMTAFGPHHFGEFPEVVWASLVRLDSGRSSLTSTTERSRRTWDPPCDMLSRAG